MNPARDRNTCCSEIPVLVYGRRMTRMHNFGIVSGFQVNSKTSGGGASLCCTSIMQGCGNGM